MKKPLTIHGIVENLMFTTRIESLVNKEGCSIEWLPLNIDPEDALRTIVEQGPNLIIMDLDVTPTSAESWIRAIRSISFERHVDIICFGSHKKTESIAAARRAGADKVLARSRFFTYLPGYLNRKLEQVEDGNQ